MVDNENDQDCRPNASNAAINRRIYSSLIRRDTKEKHIAVTKLIESNDALMRLVENLKLNIDERDNKLETCMKNMSNLRKQVLNQNTRIQELEVLLSEKDKIIDKLGKKSGGFLK